VYDFQASPAREVTDVAYKVLLEHKLLKSLIRDIPTFPNLELCFGTLPLLRDPDGLRYTIDAWRKIFLLLG